jgi:hypothetical protein
MILRVLAATLLCAVPAFAQDALTTRVVGTVRTAVAPALPFPDTDESGTTPVNGNADALWMVRTLLPGEKTIEVLANPLNQVNQVRAERAMAQIQESIEAAQRRAEAQYDRAVAEAKRTGRSQDVDGVTLSDEGVAGAKIDAETHVAIDVAFNQPAYRFEVTSAVEPGPLVSRTVPGAVAVVTVPSNTYRDPVTKAERYCESETYIYFGGVTAPDVQKRTDSRTFEVTAAAAPSGNGAVSSLVLRLRGNEVLITEVLNKTNWQAVLELMK